MRDHRSERWDWQTALQFKLDWLASFVAVAEGGSFSTAGASLYRSQSRISEHVADLERALGVKVFDRSVRPVGLTPEGRALLPGCKEILKIVASISQVGAWAKDDLGGEVRIGLYPSAAIFLFPILVKLVAAAHPGIRLRLWEGSTISIEEALLDGEIDIGVRALLPPPETPRLRHHLLWREPLVAVVPADDPLARRTRVALPDLVGRPLVMIGDAFGRGGSHFEAYQAFDRAGLVPDVAYQTSEPQTLVSLVANGLGTGITNALAMQVSNLSGVAAVPIAGAGCQRETAVWWRGARPNSPAAEVVLDLAKEAAKQAAQRAAEQAADQASAGFGQWVVDEVAEGGGPADPGNPGDAADPGRSVGAAGSVA
ncbi:MAG TPA: LysR family transcriptional regulator [Acidimicrobiales bacterium]|nr:LysR family transcriptional regulator [Acidimicrobiales bacterium]